MSDSEDGLNFTSGLVWDDSNNRLGVVAGTPSDELHVGGIARAEEGFFVDAAHEYGFAQYTYAAGDYRTRFKAYDGFEFKEGRTDTVLMTLAKGGNVGVGDPTPSYELDVNGTVRATNDLRAGDDLFVTDRAQVEGLLDVNGPIYTESVFNSGNEQVSGAIYIGAGQSEPGSGFMQIRGYKAGSGGFVYFTHGGVSSDVTIYSDGGGVGPLRAVSVRYLIRSNLTYYSGDFVMAHSNSYTLSSSGGDSLVLDFDRPIVPGTRGKLWLDHTGNATYQIVMDMLLID